MIYKKCIMTINKNNATLDEDIYLFRLDKNIELHFSIVNNRYKFDKSDLNNIIAQTNAAYFQIRLYRSDEIKYTFAIQPTQDGVAVLTITDDLINDPIELGEYDFQISLLDADKTSMISMPIVKQQLHVCEPLVDNQAIMGKAVLGLSSLASGEIKNAFDSEGNYIREVHNDGDILSAQLVNKFEEALDSNTKAIKNQDIPHTISSKVLATVPASDITIDDDVIINNVSINKDRIYYIEFLGSKKICNFIANKEMGDAILCSIGNYAIQVSLETPNITVYIAKINANDTTVDTFTDLIIHEEEVKYLDSKYLETDLVLQNSISLGRKGDIGVGSSAIGTNVIASGFGSHAEGMSTTASGESSHAEGNGSLASGASSHAEGSYTTASGGFGSHAEGSNTTANGIASHSEGDNTEALGNYSHAEGSSTIASGDYSHAEGSYTTASGECSHVEGGNTQATGDFSHAEGNGTITSGENSHAEGSGTTASSQNQHVQGKYNIEDTNNIYAHIVGNGEDGKNSNAHTLDWEGNAWYAGKLTVGKDPTNDMDVVTKKYFDANKGSGGTTIDTSNFVKKEADKGLSTNDLTDALKSNYDTAYTHSQSAHAPSTAQKNSDITKAEIEAKLTGDVTSHTHSQYLTEHQSLNGYATKNNPVFTGSVSLGRKEGTTVGENSFTTGEDVEASGESSHAEGWSSKASGYSSHAEGWSSKASGDYGPHAEGNNTTASGNYGSHAEGSTTTASGASSHAEGDYTTASGNGSHAEGYGSKASSQFQHVQGKYNIEDKNRKYAHIVGNGAGDAKRSNAHTLDWQGNGWYAGKLSQEGTPTDDKDLATKKYVDDNILLEQLPILRIDETNKRIYVNCNNMGTYKKYFVPNKYANVYGFSFIYTNEDSSETEIALIGGAMTRDDFILCTRNTDTLFILILGGTNKYTYTKSTKTLEKDLYGYLKIGNTQEYAPTENYNPATKKYVDDKVASLPQLSFNEAGELVVTINGVSKTFVPKAE